MNQFARKCKSPSEVAAALEKEARLAGSEDDISIVIIALKELCAQSAW